MGFFSWKTADTEESIPNVFSGRAIRPVYLLQPGVLAPIEEKDYEGYGVFGGVDANIWLAKNNAAHFGFDPNKMSEYELFQLGIGLDVGTVCQDVETGEFWHIFRDYRALVPGNFRSINFAERIPEFACSSNELNKSGRFKTFWIKDVVEFPYPLKFSFDKNAVYEQLPASKRCPDQGYFFEDEYVEDFD